MSENMSGAELKTKLEGLGLAPSWFGHEMSVTMRTVVRWFDLDEVAADVAEEIEILSERTVDEMRKMLAGIDDDAETVVLRTYRTDKEFTGPWPASWHRSLTFRVLDHLKAQGRSVTVEYA